jgi:hypothetical protein
MEVLAYTIALLAGCSCFALACWHEWKWWGRSKWVRTTGEVVGIELQGSEGDEHPRISFCQDGKIQEFTSDYGGTGCPRVGDLVTVLFDPVTQKAEHFTTSNRVLFTIAPLAFGILFSVIGLAGIKINGEQDGSGQPATRTESD